MDLHQQRVPARHGQQPEQPPAQCVDELSSQCRSGSHRWPGGGKVWKVLDNVEQVLAVECLTAAQAVSLRNESGMAPRLLKLQAAFRNVVPFSGTDVFLQPQMLAAREWMFSQDLDA